MWEWFTLAVHDWNWECVELNNLRVMAWMWEWQYSWQSINWMKEWSRSLSMTWIKWHRQQEQGDGCQWFGWNKICLKPRMRHKERLRLVVKLWHEIVDNRKKKIPTINRYILPAIRNCQKITEVISRCPRLELCNVRERNYDSNRTKERKIYIGWQKNNFDIWLTEKKSHFGWTVLQYNIASANGCFMTIQ